MSSIENVIYTSCLPSCICKAVSAYKLASPPQENKQVTWTNFMVLLKWHNQSIASWKPMVVKDLNREMSQQEPLSAKTNAEPCTWSRIASGFCTSWGLSKPITAVQKRSPWSWWRSESESACEYTCAVRNRLNQSSSDFQLKFFSNCT